MALSLFVLQLSINLKFLQITDKKKDIHIERNSYHYSFTKDFVWI